MPNLRKYLRHTAELERKTDRTDRFGQAVYEPPETVAARKTPVRGVVRTETGEDVEAETEIVTGPDVPVEVQDRIDGSDVRRVIERSDKAGRIIGYWSYV